MAKYFLLLFICFCIGMPSVAQDKVYTGKVEVIDIEENEKAVTFHVEGLADKKKDVIEAAKKTVFYKLFFEGVEGLNEDEKLVKRENKFWLDNFFKGDRAPYNGYVAGAQLEGEVKELAYGEYQGFVNVIVNYKALILELDRNKLRDEDGSVEEVKPKEKRSFRKR